MTNNNSNGNIETGSYIYPLVPRPRTGACTQTTGLASMWQHRFPSGN